MRTISPFSRINLLLIRIIIISRSRRMHIRVILFLLYLSSRYYNFYYSQLSVIYCSLVEILPRAYHISCGRRNWFCPLWTLMFSWFFKRKYFFLLMLSVLNRDDLRIRLHLLLTHSRFWCNIRSLLWNDVKLNKYLCHWYCLIIGHFNSSPILIATLLMQKYNLSLIISCQALVS